MTVPGRLWRGLRWIGARELASLVAVLVLTGGILTLLETADLVSDGKTRELEERVLLSMRAADDPGDPIGPAWFEAAARDVTALGSSTVMAGLVLAVVGFLLLRRRWRAGLLIALAVCGAELIGHLLKAAYGRPRPTVVSQEAHVLTEAFPSGHAMVSAAVYLTLGALLAELETRLAVRAYILLWAVLLPLGIGLSRVYLGVHWPTDVLAGWAAGACWAIMCLLAARWLERSRQLSA